MNRLVCVAAILAFALAASSFGKGSSGGHSGSHPSSPSSSHRASSQHSASGSEHHSSKDSSEHKSSKADPGVARDANGKIKRDPKQREAFMHSHPCPSTGKTSGSCPGYVVDHIKALKHGGQDVPSNMQWQTVEAAKAKDRVE